MLRESGDRDRAAVWPAGTGHRGDMAVAGGDVLLLGAHSRVGEEAPDGSFLGGCRKQHDHVAFACSGGATRAVQVVLAVLGRVDV